MSMKLTTKLRSYLYVLQANIFSIGVMSLKGSGQAKTIQTFSFASNAKNAGIAIDHNNVQGMAAYIKV